MPQEKEDNVVEFSGETRHEIPADKVLTAALGKLSTALVIGWDEEGGYYFASTTGHGGEIVWLLEVTKKALMSE